MVYALYHNIAELTNWFKIEQKILTEKQHNKS